MATVALSGADTLSINGHVFADFADGDVTTLTFPNELMTVKTGKNGNSLYGVNSSGQQAQLEIKLIRGSADDKFLNGLNALQRNNPALFPLMIGEFVKKIGDGLGALTNDTYILSGGVFMKNPEAKSNVEGDTDQSTVTYTTMFSYAPRALT